MRIHYLIALSFLLTMQLLAEGTKELAPNGNIVVDGQMTNDVTALYIGNAEYGYFAKYGEPTAEKLHVHIKDPTLECLYLGFSLGRDLEFRSADFRFYIRDPAGNIVYQSDFIDRSNPWITGWDDATKGPASIVGQDGYNNITISSNQLTSAGWTGPGDYYIEFERPDSEDVPYYILYWDITVGNCQGPAPIAKQGRVWSSSWAFFTPALTERGSNFVRPFHGKLFIVAPDPKNTLNGFVTEMNFNNSQFMGAAFSVALNSFGASTTGSIIENRKSIFQDNTIIGEYPVFLNDPIDIFGTGELGDLTIRGSSGCIPDDFCLLVTTTESGTVELFLDISGNNKTYDPNSRDVIITQFVDPSLINQEVCIFWDGKDGLGQPIVDDEFDSLFVRSSFRQGIYHFPIYDVEINLVGFQLNAVRPVGPSPLLYYDDSNIGFSSNTGSPNVNLGGCSTPCHTWTGAVQGSSYGNLNTINAWWFAQSLFDDLYIEVKQNKASRIEQEFCVNSFAIHEDSLIDQAGDHTFYYETYKGCDSVLTISYMIIDPSVDIIPDADVFDCVTDELILDARHLNLTNRMEYRWMTPDGRSWDDFDDGLFSASMPGEYHLTVTDALLGCDFTTQIELNTDYQKPEFEVLSIIDLTCARSVGEISIAIQDPISDLNISWATVDGEISATDSMPTVNVNLPGLYFLDLSYAHNGCHGYDTISVDQRLESYLELVDVQLSSSGFCVNSTIELELNSIEYSNLNWTPSEPLSCANCLNPSLLLDQVYNFEISAVDSNGCEWAHTIEAQPEQAYQLYLPTGFSPNDDGINDKYSMYSSPCPIFVKEFSIFNRWGDRVFKRSNFESTRVDQSWDGRFKNEIQPTGLYAYSMVLLGFDEEVILSGEIHLIR